MTGRNVQTTLLHAMANGRHWRISDLESLSGLARRQITRGCMKLIASGFVRRISTGRYCLTKSGIAASQSGLEITSRPLVPQCGSSGSNVRQGAWNAMRMGGVFTVNALLLATSGIWVNECGARSSLHQYCRALSLGGYLALLPGREPGTSPYSSGFYRYRLINDTGEHAPTYMPGRKRFFDHNLNKEVEVVPCK